MSFQKMAAMVSAFSLVFALVAPFYTNPMPADAAVISVELTPAETLALYGSSISGFYCAYTDDYRETSFEYVGYITDFVASISYATKNASGDEVRNLLNNVATVNTNTYLVYSCSDVAFSDTNKNIEFQFRLTPSIDISTHQLFTSILFSCPFGQVTRSSYPSSWVWMQGDTEISFTSNYSTLGSGATPLSFLTSSAGSFTPGSLSNSFDVYFRGIPVYFYSEDSFITLSSSEVNVFGSTSFQLTGSDYYEYYFLLQCPVLSSGYVVGGSGGSGGGTVSGNVTGSIDADGNITLDIPDYSDYLQQILDKLDQIASNQGYDQLTSDQQGSFDNFGDKLGSFDSTVGDYDTIESQIFSDYNPNDFLDNAEFYEPDESLFEAADNYSGLFNIQIVYTMIFIVLTVSVMSFVIFGKW